MKQGLEGTREPILYCVQLTVSRLDGEGPYNRTVQVPTFYLDESVQGIVDEAHAMVIAREIVNPFNNPGIFVNGSAVRIA